MDWLEKSLTETPWVVIDTETTGLEPSLGHRVVEVAAVRWENGRRVAEFQQLLNPERPQDPQAARITGLADAQLQNQPRFGEIYPQLAQFLEGAVLIAHNARFDADFLGLEIGLCQPTPTAAPAPWLCTLLVARRHFHFGRNHLAGVAHALGVPMRRAHRALNDVYVTAEIFKRMHKNLNGRYRLHTIGDWGNLQGEDIFTPPLPTVELPDLLATALAEQQPVSLLMLTAEGLETVTAVPRYATLHHNKPHLTVYLPAHGRLHTLPLTDIFSAEPAH